MKDQPESSEHPAKGPDQSGIFAFLNDPATYGLTEPVKRIETHGAIVFLAGPDVYKVKRAIQYPYMDFSTLAKRKAACEAEIAVNRDNAPMLYLETLPITRNAGGLCLGGDGEIIEWVVHLRRFEEAATFDHLAEEGRLHVPLIDSLARVIAATHRRGARRDGQLGTTVLRRALQTTTDAVCKNPQLFDASAAETLQVELSQSFTAAESLLSRRGRDGKVRHCHGDLHLRNIVLIEDQPVLFDAIEFDEALATCDILYDLSFLLMDLCERGLVAAANRLLNRYLWTVDDSRDEIEGLALLPLFMSLRAAIRAAVIASQSEIGVKTSRLEEEARTYFEAAGRFLETSSPCLMALGGLSGTGKSTLAAALAPALGSMPGAIHLRSDIERKHLFDAAETEHLSPNAYTPDATAIVYDRLRDLAATGLRAGRSVILDATYQLAPEREALERLAADLNTTFCGIWLEAPLDLLKQRVNERRDDASDATAAVVAAQAMEDIGNLTWTTLNADQPPDELKATVLALLTLPNARRPRPDSWFP